VILDVVEETFRVSQSRTVALHTIVAFDCQSRSMNCRSSLSAFPLSLGDTNSSSASQPPDVHEEAPGVRVTDQRRRCQEPVGVGRGNQSRVRADAVGVRRNLGEPCGRREMFFPAGSPWDAFVVLRDAFAEAQAELLIVDRYCGRHSVSDSRRSQSECCFACPNPLFPKCD
jgi:hypothetical protein